MKISTTTLLLATGLMLAQTSCQTQQTITKNNAAAEEWMAQQTAGARINVSGKWFAQSWGNATLKQSSRQITGTLDTYEVKGVVSGNKAYLTTWDSGKCYYAVILTQSSAHTLTGSYTDGPTYRPEAKDQRPIELRRSY
ncbi:MAG: hypothetical protein ABIS50_19150 [Luteolibacter sp.]|uniref:hypothetical protein n=1 Tax=Luteolibacter sp. TaxID=1962973 RepID=UPI0032643297